MAILASIINRWSTTDGSKGASGTRPTPDPVSFIFMPFSGGRGRGGGGSCPNNSFLCPP